jgi:mRNA interferase MazF
MVVVQGNAFNRSNISTVVCVPLTRNLRWANVGGNVQLPARSTGLPHDSVALVSQILTVDRRQLTDRAGQTTTDQLQRILDGIDFVLGR